MRYNQRFSKNNSFVFADAAINTRLSRYFVFLYSGESLSDSSPRGNQAETIDTFGQVYGTVLKNTGYTWRHTHNRRPYYTHLGIVITVTG